MILFICYIIIIDAGNIVIVGILLGCGIIVGLGITTTSRGRDFKCSKARNRNVNEKCNKYVDIVDMVDVVDIVEVVDVVDVVD